jgi:hypothetical protein
MRYAHFYDRWNFLMKKKSSKVDIFDHVFCRFFVDFFLKKFTSCVEQAEICRSRTKIKKNCKFLIFWSFFNIWGRGAAIDSANWCTYLTNLIVKSYSEMTTGSFESHLSAIWPKVSWTNLIWLNTIWPKGN